MCNRGDLKLSAIWLKDSWLMAESTARVKKILAFNLQMLSQTLIRFSFREFCHMNDAVFSKCAFSCTQKRAFLADL